MSLLITLAVIGGLVTLYALVCGGAYISIYIVGLIKTFSERVNNFIESLRERARKRKEAKLEKKELKEEVKESKEELKSEINEITGQENLKVEE